MRPPSWDAASSPAREEGLAGASDGSGKEQLRGKAYFWNHRGHRGALRFLKKADKKEEAREVEKRLALGAYCATNTNMLVRRKYPAPSR
jgi:hypothetical protein